MGGKHRARDPVTEAVLRARARDPGQLRGQLSSLAAAEAATYRDTYYDHPDGALAAAGRELRVRVAEASGGLRRATLTYTEAPAPEVHETVVADAAVADRVLLALGLVHAVTLAQHRESYRFTGRHRDVLAALVTIPELGAVFLELQTPATGDGQAEAMADLRAIGGELGITGEDLIEEQYADAVRRRG